MVSIGDENFRLLSLEARERGITMQELIRAVIVPDWVRNINLQRVQLDDHHARSMLMVEPDREIPPIFTRSRR